MDALHCLTTSVQHEGNTESDLYTRKIKVAISVLLPDNKDTDSSCALIGRHNKQVKPGRVTNAEIPILIPSFQTLSKWQLKRDMGVL